MSLPLPRRLTDSKNDHDAKLQSSTAPCRAPKLLRYRCYNPAQSSGVSDNMDIAVFTSCICIVCLPKHSCFSGPNERSRSHDRLWCDQLCVVAPWVVGCTLDKRLQGNTPLAPCCFLLPELIERRLMRSRCPGTTRIRTLLARQV